MYARTGKRTRIKPPTVKGADGKLVPPPAAEMDRIEWLQYEIARMERAIVEERHATLAGPCAPSWFVLFRTQQAAAMAASSNVHPLNSSLFQVLPAPGPEEVNWQALWYTYVQRQLRFWVSDAPPPPPLATVGRERGWRPGP